MHSVKQALSLFSFILQPENVLLKSLESDTGIKLADLGFAKIVSSPASLMTTPCGWVWVGVPSMRVARYCI